MNRVSGILVSSGEVAIGEADSLPRICYAQYIDMYISRRLSKSAARTIVPAEHIHNLHLHEAYEPLKNR